MRSLCNWTLILIPFLVVGAGFYCEFFCLGSSNGAVPDGGNDCGGGGGVSSAALDGSSRSSSGSELGGNSSAAPSYMPVGGGQAVSPNVVAAARRQRRAGGIHFAVGTDYMPQGCDSQRQLAADAPGGPWSRQRQAAQVMV